MKHRSTIKILCSLLILFMTLLMSTSQSVANPLPSWNNGPARTAIIRFVKRVTNPASPDYVAPNDRIATFDNDGTLWIEQPMYTQIQFDLDRITSMANDHPYWQDQPPFSYVLKKEYGKLKKEDILKIMLVAESGMTVETYESLVKEWLATTKNKYFDRSYPELIYQPMLEVINYLKKHQFKIYIVSGGGQDFIRAFSEKTYGIPVENVIGSTQSIQYMDPNGTPQMIRLAHVSSFNDGAVKPQNIHLFIGKKPIIAFGNSDGDQQMLEWTQAGDTPHLMLLVHHDDKKREYAYGPHSKIGTFSDALMKEATDNHWHVISMKNDWKKIWPSLPAKVSDNSKQATSQPNAFSRLTF